MLLGSRLVGILKEYSNNPEYSDDLLQLFEEAYERIQKDDEITYNLEQDLKKLKTKIDDLQNAYDSLDEEYSILLYKYNSIT